jgi:preprotein translocase subunit SecD
VADELDPLSRIDVPPDEVKLLEEHVACGGTKMCIVHYVQALARVSEPMDHVRARVRAVLAQVDIPDDTRWGLQLADDGDGDKGWRSYLLRREMIVNGSDVVNARVRDEANGPSVQITLSEEAAKRFATYTRDHLRTRLAIVFEGQVQSAPMIMGEIAGGNLVLTMGSPDGRAEAERVAQGIKEFFRASPR